VIYFGTPNGLGGSLFRLEHSGKASVHHLTTRDNPYITVQAFDELKATLTPAAQSQELDGEYTSGDQQVFTKLCEPLTLVPQSVPRWFLPGIVPTLESKLAKSAITLTIDWGVATGSFMLTRFVVMSDGIHLHIAKIWENDIDGNGRIPVSALKDKAFEALKAYSALYPVPIVLMGDPSQDVELLELGGRVTKELRTCTGLKADNRVPTGIAAVSTLLEEHRLTCEPVHIERVNEVLGDYSYALNPDGTVDYYSVLENQRDEICDILRYAVMPHKGYLFGASKPDNTRLFQDLH
jgi:hypothetical protein